MFVDRYQAGYALAEKLEKYKGTNSIILALPRGGVPVGYVLAEKLELPLDVAMIKKLGHPINKEFGVGSVSLSSYTVEPDIILSPEYVRTEVERIREGLKARYKMYTGDGQFPAIKRKTVIIVDDGLATGSTMLAAIETVRNEGPAKIVAAVPVAPRTTADKVAKQVDEFVCIYSPADFHAVSLYYQDFTQVSDEEVISLLKEAKD